MKKRVFFLSSMAIVSACGSLMAATMQGKTGPLMTPQASDCSQMSKAEQSFASQLNDSNNKLMFCSKFTAQQRQQAMQMLGKPDSSGNMTTADQAVQKTMQNNNMMAPPAPKSSRPSGGGCPVK